MVFLKKRLDFFLYICIFKLHLNQLVSHQIMNNNYKNLTTLLYFVSTAFEKLLDVLIFISFKIRDMFRFFDSYSSKYYFSMNVFNDLKKIKLSTKTKFKPTINNFF